MSAFCRQRQTAAHRLRTPCPEVMPRAVEHLAVQYAVVDGDTQMGCDQARVIALIVGNEAFEYIGENGDGIRRCTLRQSAGGGREGGRVDTAGHEDSHPRSAHSITHRYCQQFLESVNIVGAVLVVDWLVDRR